ncbi:MAG: cytochrome c biogenesis protein CcsA [candidate division NC10 bacterium]|nr:cytochrome c biogenesis protein CcsA [candidate division NC10 bacterium]
MGRGSLATRVLGGTAGLLLAAGLYLGLVVVPPDAVQGDVQRITLATGMIWGKPTWGVWWTWDARLTLTAILFTIYVGYLMLRAFAEEPLAGARYGAVLAILGFLDIPLNHLAVYWWRTLHQPSSILRPGGPSVASDMLLPLAMNFAGLVLLSTYFLVERVRLERLRHRTAEVRLTRGRRG